MAALVFIAIPSASSLSMRQVAELSITLCLSLISFILLLLSVFLGGTSLWRDIERRYTYSVLGLPISRSSYVLGKFGALAGLVLLVSAIFGIVSFAVIKYAATVYEPSRPLLWHVIFLSILFSAFKYILLIAFAFLFSSVSTSFFLPIFGAIAVFFTGSATQQVYDYIHIPQAQTMNPVIKQAATALYYVLPNFSAFDLKVNAVYSIPPSVSGLLLTGGYFVVYTSIVMLGAIIIFSKRELT
jgi:ABC-type transport system involved in multi-copper enzyme maturation permease subunit